MIFRKTVFEGVTFKVGDGIVLLLVLTAAVVSAVMAYAGPGRRQELVIEGPGGSWVFPLSAEETVSVPGPLGITAVELRGGRARVLSSPCTNQLCVAAGAIGTHGQWIACLPNRVLVRVAAENGAGNGAKDGGEEIDGTAW
jgi:hypothetical protein